MDSLSSRWRTDGGTPKRESLLHDVGSWPEARSVTRTLDALRNEHAAPSATLNDSTTTIEEELERISPVFRGLDVPPKLVHVEYDPATSTMAEQIANENYDMVVLGTENRAITNRMFFGYENQMLIERLRITTLIVVPKLAMLH